MWAVKMTLIYWSLSPEKLPADLSQHCNDHPEWKMEAINVKIGSGELGSCSTRSACMTEGLKTLSGLSVASLCCSVRRVSALHCHLFTLTTTIIYRWEVFINGEERGSDAARLGWGAAAWNHFETKRRRNPTFRLRRSERVGASLCCEAWHELVWRLLFVWNAWCDSWQ